MEIRKIFETANNQISLNLNISLDNISEELGKITSQINAFKCRSTELESELVEEIIYDLFISLQLSMSGLYKHSFISTRCALELGIALIKFKDDNLSYLYWKNNSEDISWSSFFKEERGILSQKYLKLFNPEGNFDKIILVAGSVYRECSEYVHGKYGYIRELNDSRIAYNKDLNKKSIDMCFNTIKILNTLLCIRFGNHNDSNYTIYENLIKEFEV